MAHWFSISCSAPYPSLPTTVFNFPFYCSDTLNELDLLDTLKLSTYILLVVIFFFLTSISCSNKSLSVDDISWKCQKKNFLHICNVKFTLENANHFPIAATVVIRAHQWENQSYSGPIISLIPEKKLSIVLEPNEIREFQETFEDARRVRKFIVTTYDEKKV